MAYGYKDPKTTAERRQAEAMLTDEVCISLYVYPRAARTGHNLPNAWDDVPQGKRGRSWKAHRRTQYKAVAV